MKWLLLGFILCALPAQALELSGRFAQGGFIFGRTTPQTTVQIEGKTLTSDEQGYFVYGLSRHAPAEVTVRVEGRTRSIIVEPREYDVQHIKGVKKRHVTPDPKDMKRIRADSRAIKQARSVFEPLAFFNQRFVLPVSGTITGVYGSSRTYNGEERSWHKGLDIATPTGTPISAPADGVVRLALEESFFNGNLIILDHGHQFMTIYAHLDSMAVKAGEKVKQGQHIGAVGTTGRSTGPHLHWGLYWHNVALDPQLLLQ